MPHLYVVLDKSARCNYAYGGSSTLSFLLSLHLRSSTTPSHLTTQKLFIETANVCKMAKIYVFVPSASDCRWAARLSDMMELHLQWKWCLLKHRRVIHKAMSAVYAIIYSYKWVQGTNLMRSVPLMNVAHKSWVQVLSSTGALEHWSTASSFQIVVSKHLLYLKWYTALIFALSSRKEFIQI